MDARRIEWASLSRYRGVLMGIAIIMIVLFHVALPRSSAFFGLKRMGNMGVDIFFFLSGIGLWFAWTKRPELLHFYRRRLLRILPAWLLASTAFYLPDYLGPRRFSSSLPDLIGDITVNWDFWIHDELTFWYIPATLMLYLWAPWFMRLVMRNRWWSLLPVLMMAWCVAVLYLPTVHHAVGHIEIFWSRVPIFFIGIVAGQWVKEQYALPRAALPVVAVTALFTLALCIALEQTVHGRFPIFLERMLYIPLTLAATLWLCHYLHCLPQRVAAALTFVGGISLEIYLLHCHFILKYIEPLALGYWPTALLCLAITIPLAWLIHQLLNVVIKLLRL